MQQQRDPLTSVKLTSHYCQSALKCDCHAFALRALLSQGFLSMLHSLPHVWQHTTCWKCTTDIPQPHLSAAAVLDYKKLLTIAKTWGDFLHSQSKALLSSSRAFYETLTDQQGNGVFWYSGLQKWEQKQLLHKNGPRKLQGNETLCFRC